MSNSKPTLFGPVKHRANSRRNGRSESWQALFVPVEKTPSSASTASRHSTHTLRNYLQQHFLTQPVSVFTEAGRIQGKVVEVTQEHVILETLEGSRAVDLHAIFSVAHQLPPR